jgi:hypothetical protein
MYKVYAVYMYVYMYIPRSWRNEEECGRSECPAIGKGCDSLAVWGEGEKG